MNLKKLFDMQIKLMERIENEHPLKNGEDRFSKKVVALLVEVGECANEWKGFKYWKVNPVPTEKLLEEYVDGLHFVLELGIEVGYRNMVYNQDHKYKEDHTINQFLLVYSLAQGMNEDDYFGELLHAYIYLGEKLGFAWNEIEKAYINKNEINHDRQDNGY